MCVLRKSHLLPPQQAEPLLKSASSASGSLDCLEQWSLLLNNTVNVSFKSGCSHLLPPCSHSTRKMNKSRVDSLWQCVLSLKRCLKNYLKSIYSPFNILHHSSQEK